jgi:hypothetical protein
MLVLGGGVIVDSAGPLDLFDDLARVLLCLGRDVRVMHSGLAMATGMMLRHCDGDIKAEVNMNYAPCGLQRRGWVLTYCMRVALC